MEMKDRIAKIIKKEQLTSQQFAEIIEIQSSTISHILAGRNLPSFKIISNLLEKFPKISPDWLIFGKGEMLRGEDKSGKIEDFAPIIETFTNMNQIEEIIDNIVDEQVLVDNYSEVRDEDVESKIAVDKGIIQPTPPPVPERILIMYSDKTFEIFNLK